MKKLLIGILLLLFVLQSCNSIKLEKDPTKASPTIVYSKSPCFGKCPVFTLTIYNTGLAKFNGRKYTQMDGKHEKQLSKSKYIELIKAFRERRFWRFDDSYGMDLVDAPTVTMSFSDNGKLKTVKGKSGFPEKLVELSKILDEIIEDEDMWLMTDKPIRSNIKEEIIENQIIIKIGEGMIMSRWLQDYKKYGLRLMKRVGATNDVWLVRFDKNIINPKDMLKMIKEDKYISSAEFNKKITER